MRKPQQLAGGIPGGERLRGFRQRQPTARRVESPLQAGASLAFDHRHRRLQLVVNDHRRRAWERHGLDHTDEVHGHVSRPRPAREEPQRGRGVVGAVERDDDGAERTATALHDEHRPCAMAHDPKRDAAQQRAFHAAEPSRADDDEIGVPLLGGAHDLGTRIAFGHADLGPGTGGTERGARVQRRHASLRRRAVGYHAEHGNRRAVQQAGPRDPFACMHRVGGSITGEQDSHHTLPFSRVSGRAR
jgi:hypothetical protein